MALAGVILLARLAGPVWWWLLVPLGVWAAFKAGRYILRLGREGSRKRLTGEILRWDSGSCVLKSEPNGMPVVCPISHAIEEFLDGRIKLDDLPEEDTDRMLPVVRAVLKRNGVSKRSALI